MDTKLKCLRCINELKYEKLLQNKFLWTEGDFFPFYSCSDERKIKSKGMVNQFFWLCFTLFYRWTPLTNNQHPTCKRRNFVNDMQLLLNEYFIVRVEHEILIFIQCSVFKWFFRKMHSIEIWVYGCLLLLVRRRFHW